MVTEKKRHTFISYSRTNKEFALRLARELKAAGFPIWLDQLDIPTGTRWDDEIEKALRECRIFMVILTPASIASDNAKDEIGYAIDHGKRILPVLLEDCEIPLRLRRFQYVDFTRMNYTEGVRSAKELLARLIEEESAPTITKVPASKERLTQPAKSRSARSTSSHQKAAPADTAKAIKKPLLTKLIAVFAGIAALVLVVLIAGASLWRGMLPFGRQSTTSTPTPEIKPTNTPSPTAIADTATLAPPGAQVFYTEEFDESNPAWMPFMKSGPDTEVIREINNGKLVIHIPLQKTKEPWGYLINTAFTYSDVKMEVITTNTGINTNGVSLVCRYSDSGWYEFRISNGGKYSIYAFGPNGKIPQGGYELVADASSNEILIGKATNVYTATCNGNKLSLDINGTQVKTINARYDFPEGNIGIGFSSPQNIPVDVEFESVKISQP